MAGRCENVDLLSFLGLMFGIPHVQCHFIGDGGSCCVAPGCRVAHLEWALTSCLKGLLSFFDAARLAEERAPESSEWLGEEDGLNLETQIEKENVTETVGRGGDCNRMWRSGRTRCPRPCAECYSSVGWCGAVVAVVSDQSRSVSRSPPCAGGTSTGGRVVVNFRDDHSRLLLWPVDAGAWIVLTLGGDMYAERCVNYARVRVGPSN